MDEIPYELIENIIDNLSFKDIINYCMTNKSLASICSDANFWKRRARLEGYPDNLITNDSPAKSFYRLIKYGSCLKNGHTVGNLLSKYFQYAIYDNDLPVIRELIKKASALILMKALDYSVANDRPEIGILILDSLTKYVTKHSKLYRALGTNSVSILKVMSILLLRLS